MTNTIILAVVGVLSAWVLIAFAIRYWGPGLVRKHLLCPEKKVLARVTFLRNEGSFGSLKVADVKQCSLFSEGPVTCEKHCMG
ncbi:MAG: hypothetical protein HY647_08470 [Acidobacteria bacterium]|nr:hypothetical protein [Acidobacteriota bacterium]